MDDDPEAFRPGASGSRPELRFRRVALAFVFGFVGFTWAAIALAVGTGPLPVFAVLAIAAFTCFAAAWGLLAFKRWAAIVSAVAFLGSLGLGFVVYLSIRSAFATYPF